MNPTPHILKSSLTGSSSKRRATGLDEAQAMKRKALERWENDGGRIPLPRKDPEKSAHDRPPAPRKRVGRVKQPG